MSFEDEALRKTNSDIIQFDNIFSNDLAREQEFDLVFGAQEDDDIVKMVESETLFDADGDEIIFEDVDEELFLTEDDDEDDDDEEEIEDKDISSNDANGNGTDDDMEEAPKPAPSVQVDIDADNVNINAADDSTSVKEDGEVNVTAQVVNITPSANPIKTASDLSTALGGSDTPAPADAAVATDEPAPEPEQQPVNGGDDAAVASDIDNALNNPAPTPVDAGEDDDMTDAPVEEGVEELSTASDLEDKLNAGLDPAPAPEETSFTNQPDDNSTEVVFGDYNDMEEKSDIYGESNDIVDNGDPTLGDAPESSYNGIEVTPEPAHKDTSEDETRYESNPDGEVEDAMTTTDDLQIESSDILPEDPQEEYVENDAKTSLLSIGPGLTAGDLGSMFDNAVQESNDLASLAEESEVEDALGDLDDGVKVDEPEDVFANMQDTVATATYDDENEHISGEEGQYDTADAMWSDAQSAPHIVDDSKLNAADSETDYDDNMTVGSFKEESDDIDDWEDSLSGDDDSDDSEDDFENDLEECGSGCKKEEVEDDNFDDWEDNMTSEGCCKEEEQGVEMDDNDGGNTSDDNISAELIGDDHESHANKGDDEEIVDDKEQNGIKITDGGNFNGESVCPHCGKNPCECECEKEDTDLDVWVAEMAADDEKIIPDITEVPEEDMDPDEEARKQTGKYPGNDGSDPEVGTFAEDYQDIVDAQSDDDVFNPDINKGLENSPEAEEPGSIEEEIDNEAIDVVLGLK